MSLVNITRLRILIILKNEKAGFSKLKHNLHLTDGNLSSKLKELEESGYVKSNRIINGNHMNRILSITTLGLKTLDNTVEEIKELLK